MYNSDLGRWISPDPYREFFSPYQAMGNNPVTFTDPTGGYLNDPSPEQINQAFHNALNDMGSIFAQINQYASEFRADFQSWVFEQEMKAAVVMMYGLGTSGGGGYGPPISLGGNTTTQVFFYDQESGYGVEIGGDYRKKYMELNGIEKWDGLHGNDEITNDNQIQAIDNIVLPKQDFPVPRLRGPHKELYQLGTESWIQGAVKNENITIKSYDDEKSYSGAVTPPPPGSDLPYTIITIGKKPDPGVWEINDVHGALYVDKNPDYRDPDRYYYRYQLPLQGPPGKVWYYGSISASEWNKQGYPAWPK